MDFSTVYHRLENNLYTDPDVFVRDVRLIFSNSRAYNTIPRSRVIMSYLNLLQIRIRTWDVACILPLILFPLPLLFLSSFGFRLQIYSMTIRLSAMFEDRIDNVLSDWYESESGGARRTRLRTIRLLESHAPGSSGVPRQRMPRSGSHTNTASSSDVGSNSDSLNTRETRTRSIATRAAITAQSEQTNGHHSERTETRGNVRAISQSRNQQNNDNTFEETDVLASGRPSRSTRSSARRELVMRFPASRIRQSSQEEAVANGPSVSRYSTRRSASLAQRTASVNDEESEEEEEEEEGEEEEEEEIGEEEQGGSDEEDEEQGGDSEGDEDEEEDDEEEEEDEEEETDDSTEDSRHQTRRKTARPTHRPTVALRTKRASTTNARSNRANSSTSSARRTSETSQRNAIAPARRSLRRNSAARRVRYNENDSDSESDSVNNEIIGVSSRGRVRKPAIRMQDYVE